MDEGRPVRVAIALCTRERTSLLERCLRSLIDAKACKHLVPSVVVVENDVHPASRSLVERIGTEAPFPVFYAHESDLGIPQARNRSVEEALALSPDWIVFIDDDEVVPPDWWRVAFKGMGTLDADVLVGIVQPRSSTEIPLWLRPSVRRRKETGEILDTAPTNNTFAKAWLFEKTGLGLRFDPGFRFSGGEDVELFLRATAGGATIRRYNELVVHEYWPPGRLTMRYNLGRRYSNLLHREKIELSPLSAVVASTARKSVEATCYMLASVPFLMIDQERAKRLAYKSLVKIVEIAALLGGRLGITTEPYKTIPKNEDRTTASADKR